MLTGKLLLKIRHAVALGGCSKALAALPLTALPLHAKVSFAIADLVSGEESDWVFDCGQKVRTAGRSTLSCWRMAASMVRVRLVSAQLT